MSEYDPDWEVDFGAEKMIAAFRGKKKIAVEVKSFTQQSFAYEFHRVLGQYLNYRVGLQEIEKTRTLFLAVPIDVYETEFMRHGISKSLKVFKVKLLIYHPEEKKIIKWIP
jgi:XisH protein